MDILSTHCIIKNAFFVQTAIGFSANIFFLFFHIFIFLQDHRPKPHDLISCHLAFIHVMMLLTVVFNSSQDTFESLPFLNDFKCKTLFFINRVLRGLSICTTCHLSVFQAITISPSTSWLAKFKHKFRNNIIVVYLFLWSVNLSFSGNMIFFTVAAFNVTQTNLLKASKYCSVFPMTAVIRGVFLALTLSRDVFFVGIMLISSTYMVIFLSRHQRQSQNLHSTSLSPRVSPEKRASQTILLLVSFFVVTYLVDLIISTSSYHRRMYSTFILSVQILVSHTHATVTPLVQMCSDKRIMDIFQNMQPQCHQF
ncbi:vomeronasal type-1 receptor 47-like [Microcebus murinus]|uniref:vomeronasal type-1 receptor 47-like n=1 Tax=Microcebus murinus TaxID=30608 RepID=UPI003F6CE011